MEVAMERLPMRLDLQPLQFSGLSSRNLELDRTLTYTVRRDVVSELWIDPAVSRVDQDTVDQISGDQGVRVQGRQGDLRWMHRVLCQGIQGTHPYTVQMGAA